MNTRAFDPRIALQLAAAAVVATASIGWYAGAHAQSTPQAAATQTSAERNVMIMVTPTPWLVGADGWDFSVKLDTHRDSLDDDLVKTAVLLIDGREVAPTGWTGSPLGGHHREGALKFPAPSQAPISIELRIQRVRETAPRVFRWDGAALR